jgi:beta-lactamase class D
MSHLSGETSRTVDEKGRTPSGRYGHSLVWAAVAMAVFVGLGRGSRAVTAPQSGTSSCFLLHEAGVGEVRRAPADVCSQRFTPASTFKVPHALAALDAGVIAGKDATFKYDGREVAYPSWKRDHTLASAMHNSVLWYFQRLAEKLGAAREREYLEKFDYGNRDSSSGLTTFWLGESLAISPEEQVRFLTRLFADELPVSRSAMQVVREILVQPQGSVVNAAGTHPFASPWPTGTVVSAKTGSATNSQGRSVRWIVGHVRRGQRSWIFVSCVTGPDLPALAAVELAARALREQKVL